MAYLEAIRLLGGFGLLCGIRVPLAGSPTGPLAELESTGLVDFEPAGSKGLNADCPARAPDLSARTICSSIDNGVCLAGGILPERSVILGAVAG